MTLNDYLDFILPDVPGCASAVAKRAALRTAMDFLTQSQAWTEVQDAVDVQEGEQDYFLEAPSGARTIDIKAIYTRNAELTPVTMEQLAAVLPDWQTAEGSAPEFYTRAFDFTTYRVFPIPADPNGETLRVHAVYTLKDTATSIPDDIVRDYGEVIAHGAKGRLMTMPGVAWKDLQLAQYHQAQYDDGLLIARIKAAHGKTAATMSAQPRRFGQ